MHRFTLIFAASASLAVAAPTQSTSTKVSARQNTEVLPEGTYRRYINTGETISDPEDQPFVVKNGNFEDETSTIVTFNFDEDTEGKTCELNFKLGEEDVSKGTKTMDIFTWTNPGDLEALIAGTTINNEMSIKSRNQQAGRVIVSAPGNAEWTMSYNGWPSIPCPAGELIGIEYVGAGEGVEVGWESGSTGPRFVVFD